MGRQAQRAKSFLAGEAKVLKSLAACRAAIGDIFNEIDLIINNIQH